MALSTLVPTTVSSITLLAKSSIPALQIWSLHGLLLTIEAAGLSFVSHVQVIKFMTLDSCEKSRYCWEAVWFGVSFIHSFGFSELGGHIF